MMYVKDLAAVARLTLVVVGSLPMAAALDGQTSHATDQTYERLQRPLIWQQDIQKAIASLMISAVDPVPMHQFLEHAFYPPGLGIYTSGWLRQGPQSRMIGLED